jgi:NAD(P)-dependent dehydrogenase (short-subunit alcohol dehydrogenase family)
VRADVGSEEELESAFRTIDERLGPVDIAFANAGIAGAGGELEQMTLADWYEVMDVNLAGVFLTMRAAARRMTPRGYGKLILVGSLYSVTGDRFFGGAAFLVHGGWLVS